MDTEQKDTQQKSDNPPHPDGENDVTVPVAAPDHISKALEEDAEEVEAWSIAKDKGWGY